MISMKQLEQIYLLFLTNKTRCSSCWQRCQLPHGLPQLQKLYDPKAMSCGRWPGVKERFRRANFFLERSSEPPELLLSLCNSLILLQVQILKYFHPEAPECPTPSGHSPWSPTSGDPQNPPKSMCNVSSNQTIPAIQHQHKNTGNSFKSRFYYHPSII